MDLPRTVYLLTQANVARILRHDPFNINVSLESVDPQVNESLRPRKNGTRQTLEGIENVVQEKRRCGSRVSMIVKPTIMEQNYRTLPELVRYFGRYPEVQISPQPYFGTLDSGFWIKDVAGFERVAEELKELRKSGARLLSDERALDGFVSYFRTPAKSQSIARIDLGGQARHCDIGYRSLEIFSDGSVQFCDLLKTEIGNVNRQSLSDIYYGEAARRHRERIARCNLNCQRTCQRPISLPRKPAHS